MRRLLLFLPLWVVVLHVATVGQVPTPTGEGPDRIRMVTGQVITGTIVRETDELVEIRVAKGMVMGIEKARTLEIVRTSHLNKQPDRADRPKLLEERNLHFLVMDGAGKVIGTRRMVVKEERLPRGKYGWLLEESWTFCQPKKPRLLLTRCEHLSSILRPISCFYREVSGNTEKVVRGLVQGEKITVKVLTGKGRRQAALPFVHGMRFPLMHRELIRQRERTTRKEITATVYDPMEDVFKRLVIETGLRRSGVKGPWGDWGTVFVLRERRGKRVHQEWLDDKGRTLYLEANGLDLTAVRCTPDQARRVAATGLAGGRIPELVRGTNALLRLPDPGWNFRDGRRPEAVCADLEASLETMVVAGEEGRHPLPEVARYLARRIALNVGEIRDLTITPLRQGVGKAVSFTGRLGAKGGDRISGMIYRRNDGSAVALLLQAPHRNWQAARVCMEKVGPRLLPPQLPATPQ